MDKSCDKAPESAKETTEETLTQNPPCGTDDTLITTDHNKSSLSTNEDESCSGTEKNTSEESDSIVLPSKVTDEDEIYFPHDISSEDPTIYGKWLIFPNGNVQLQDEIWIQLHELIKKGELILIASSTFKQLCDPAKAKTGVIKCYTAKDINKIKSSGLAIQNILKDNSILDYKTNEASKKNLFREFGNRFIAKFMLTVNGMLYRRDKLHRWTQIPEAEYENFKFEEDEPEKDTEHGSPLTKRRHFDSYLLPSLETRNKHNRYTYPDKARLANWSGVWCLFCSITDADDNGLTKLDRAWKEARVLCDKKIFKSVFCETLSYKYSYCNNIPKRTVMCEVNNTSDTDQIMECADELRKKVLYNKPMYYKTFHVVNRKPRYDLKFLYTEDKELYVFDERKWILLKRG